MMKSSLFYKCSLGFLLLLAAFTYTSSCNKYRQAAISGDWDTTGTGPDSISFLVMGDWGRYGAGAQRSVADAMDEVGRKHKIQFIITTGDNFYPSGVANIYDRHWEDSYENIYNKEGHKVPWYPVLGNHDYGINPKAQIEYSTISNRWKMPARYYSISKKLDSAQSVVLAFTDTSPFINGYYGGAFADISQQDTAAQLRWLKNTLGNATTGWKIVFGHHPVYSVGPHGNTPELLDRFRPVFLQTNTDLYICGHDHSLQYIVEPSEKVKYLVSGAGGEYTSVNPNATTLFARSTPGFLIVTIYPSRAQLYFYNQRSEVLYTGQVKK